MKALLSRLAAALSLRRSHGCSEGKPAGPVVQIPERIPRDCSALGRTCRWEGEDRSNGWRETCLTCGKRQQGSGQ